MKRRLSTILFGVVFIAGLSLLLYPTVSDYWNSFHQSRAIASYVDAVDNTDEQKLDEMRKAAQAYNEKLLSKQDRYEMSDQTRTIYRNSDGYPLVIYPNGDGTWCDDDGNTYDFANGEDVYDENGVDYYYHGEPAYVRYMPKNQ